MERASKMLAKAMEEENCIICEDSVQIVNCSNDNTLYGLSAEEIEGGVEFHSRIANLFLKHC